MCTHNIQSAREKWMKFIAEDDDNMVSGSENRKDVCEKIHTHKTQNIAGYLTILCKYFFSPFRMNEKEFHSLSFAFGSFMNGDGVKQFVVVAEDIYMRSSYTQHNCFVSRISIILNELQSEKNCMNKLSYKHSEGGSYELLSK